MPNTKSAKKSLLTDAKRRMQNQVRKSRVRTSLRRFLELIEQNDAEGAASVLKTCYADLDRAAKCNAVSKNRANRTKSRLTKRLTAIQS